MKPVPIYVVRPPDGRQWPATTLEQFAKDWCSITNVVAAVHGHVAVRNVMRQIRGLAPGQKFTFYSERHGAHVDEWTIERLVEAYVAAAQPLSIKLRWRVAPDRTVATLRVVGIDLSIYKDGQIWRLDCDAVGFSRPDPILTATTLHQAKKEACHLLAERLESIAEQLPPIWAKSRVAKRGRK